MKQPTELERERERERESEGERGREGGRESQPPSKGVAVLDFDTGRPVDRLSDYYAVCDICLSARGSALQK